MNITKHIPNTITSMNLISGVLGVVCSFYGRLDLSFYLMISAAIFDFFDGFSARLLNAYSAVGKELDSLADLISFGLLPAVMMHRLMMIMGVELVWITLIPFVLVVFSALRLAKFNVDERQSENFIGLATPSAALLSASLVYFILSSPHSFLTTWAEGYVFIPVLATTLSFLLVSELPMFSLKFKKKSTSKFKVSKFIFLGGIIASTIVTLVLGLNWSLIVLLSFLIYIIINIVGTFVTSK